MTLTNCNCRLSCTFWGLIAGLIIGVVGAFLQITAVITIAPVFLWVALGIAVGYLAILMVTTALDDERQGCGCRCAAVNTLLLGILGAILFAAVLLAVGIVATSVLSAILVGVLLFFLTLIFTGSACLVRCASGCEA